jgi:uncharacterized protein YggE
MKKQVFHEASLKQLFHEVSLQQVFQDTNGKQVCQQTRFEKFFTKSLLSCLVLVSFLAIPSKAEEQNTNLLHVNGVGQYTVSPDIGELVLGIEADGKSAAEAQTRASAVLTAFIGQLKSIGIQSNEIKTVESSLNPVRDYNGKPPYRILSYSAVQKVRVRVAGESRLNLISRAVDLATTNSINRIESVQFSVSPDLNKEANRKALAIASDDALKTGQEVLTKMSLRLVKVKDIQLNSAPRNYPYPMPMMRAKAETMMAGAADSAPEITSIMPGELVIEATANLTLEFDK